MDSQERGHRLETGRDVPKRNAERPAGARVASIPADGPANSFVDVIGRWSIGRLLTLWAAMIVGFGLIYWASGALAGNGLRAGAGHVRVFAIAEGAAGLLIFGVLMRSWWKRSIGSRSRIGSTACERTCT